jgi:hypothetical protein
MRNLKPRQSSFAKFDTGNSDDSQPLDIVAASSGTSRCFGIVFSTANGAYLTYKPCLSGHPNLNRTAEVAALTRDPSLKRGNSSQIRRSMQARNNSYLARTPSTQETEESITPSNEELIGK